MSKKKPLYMIMVFLIHQMNFFLFIHKICQKLKSFYIVM